MQKQQQKKRRSTDWIHRLLNVMKDLLPITDIDIGYVKRENIVKMEKTRDGRGWGEGRK